ncbi:MAG: hypothetical protein NVS4B6_17680 [Mycobacterium sp.]
MAVRIGMQLEDVYYDPDDVEPNADPYPMFGRIREVAPIYINDRYGFCATQLTRRSF